MPLIGHGETMTKRPNIDLIGLLLLTPTRCGTTG